MPACRSGNLSIVLPYWNAMSRTQDMKPHTVKVYRPVVLLSIDVECRTENQIDLFQSLGSDPTEKSIYGLPHTKRTLYTNTIT